MDESNNSANKKQSRQKPPLSVSRIVGEILGGLGMGFAIKLLAACIGSIVFLGVGGEADTRMAFVATLSKVALPVYGIVSAVGVYLFGSRGKQTGSFLVTLAFGFIAGLFMIVMNRLVRISIELMLIRYVLEFLTPTIIATVGFNLTRRYKDGKNIMDESITTANKMQNCLKLSLSVFRIGVEIIAGMVMGFAAVLLCVFVTGIELSHGVDDGVFRFLLMSFYFAPPLYGLGSAIGVYFVGSRGKQTGSLLAALGGGVLGGIVIFIMLPLANRLSEVPIVRLFRVFSLLVLLVPPIAATIGFDLTRRYKYYILPHVKDMRKSIDESVNTPTKKKSSQKPPLSILRIAGEILVGAVLGFIAVHMINIMLFGNSDFSGSVGQLQALGVMIFNFFANPLVYVIGSSVGVYLIGSIGRQTGSPLATLGGSVLGLCVMVLLFVFIGVPSNGLLPMTTGRLVVTEEMERMIVILALSTLSAPIMATIGFNLTRKYKEHKKQTSSSKSRLQIILMVLAICSIIPAIMCIGSCGLIIPLILFALALVLK